MRARLLIASFGVLIGFFFAEAAWRVYLYHFASQEHFEKWVRAENMPPGRLRYRPHPYMAYALNPNYRSADGLNRHNSLGFRGAEIAREKPPGVYRIACVGASSTYDVAIADDRLTFPAQLQKVLRGTYAYEGVEVVNAGVGGYTTWESLVNLQFRVLDIDPDLVIIYHATNDVQARLIPPGAYRRDNTGHRRSWADEPHWWDASLLLHYFGVQWGLSQRNSLGDRIQVQYPEGSISELNPPTFFRANLENMVALARYRGVSVLLTSWAWTPLKGDYASTPLFQRGFREHNEISKGVGRENGVPFYDFAAQMPTDPEYWADGRHNNERGARKKAELFAAFLHTTFGEQMRVGSSARR